MYTRCAESKILHPLAVENPVLPAVPRCAAATDAKPTKPTQQDWQHAVSANPQATVSVVSTIIPFPSSCRRHISDSRTLPSASGRLVHHCASARYHWNGKMQIGSPVLEPLSSWLGRISKPWMHAVETHRLSSFPSQCCCCQSQGRCNLPLSWHGGTSH